jgi:hypothetical protein
VADAIQQGKPIVLLFYVSGSTDDAAGPGQPPEAAAGILVVPTFSASTTTRPHSAYGDLSTLRLDVNYPPELILIDGNGYHQSRSGTATWTKARLNQSLVNLGQGL